MSERMTVAIGKINIRLDALDEVFVTKDARSCISRIKSLETIATKMHEIIKLCLRNYWI